MDPVTLVAIAIMADGTPRLIQSQMRSMEACEAMGSRLFDSGRIMPGLLSFECRVPPTLQMDPIDWYTITPSR